MNSFRRPVPPPRGPGLMAVAAVALLVSLFVAPTSRAGSSPPAQVPPDWHRVDTGPFSVALPPDWQYVPRMGIDSFVGEFAGGGVRLTFDYGLYSNCLPDPGTPGYQVTFETIDGKEAKIVVARQPPARITGVYFARARGVVICDDEFVDRLNVVGRDLTPQQQTIALTIFRSIRFPKPGQWQPVQIPDVPALYDVQILSSDEAWAVGAEGTILHFTSDRWAAVSSPTRADLFGLEILGQEGWAVGDKTILHYANRTWTLVTDAAPGPLLALDMVTAEDGWSVGPEALMRYQDGQWVVSGEEVRGVAIDVARPDSGWVVGGEALYRYDGRWQRVAWPRSPSARGLAIDMPFGDEGWIAGVYDNDGTGMLTEVCRHVFDEQQTPAGAAIRDVQMDRLGDVWAAGGALDRPAVLMSYRDGQWSLLDSPLDAELHALDMLSGRWRVVDGWAAGGRKVGGRVRGVLLRYEAAPPPTPTATPSASVTHTAPPPTATRTPTAPAGSRQYLPLALSRGLPATPPPP